MGNLQFEADRTEILGRLANLTPDSERKWGTLTPVRLLPHLADGFRIAYGESKPEFKPSFASSWLVRWLVISSPMPWPKGKVKAPPAFFESEPGEFDADLEQVAAYVRRFPEHEEPWGVSPAFGPLSAKQWGRLHWRHLNHHLRQFGE